MKEKCGRCARELPAGELYDFAEWGHGKYCGNCLSEVYCPTCECGRVVTTHAGQMPCPTCNGTGLVIK
jgi:hypothetical protein